tara:strand:- start:1603 stop:2310 length:708 start_codon:yes stop_codon:yes gene_type:complete
MHTLLETADLRITSRAPAPVLSGGGTLVSFTGIGHGMGGVDVQKAEFFGAGRRFDNLIFVTDKTRSWGNRIDFNEVARVLAPFAVTGSTCAIGNSMGGFLAIVMSAFMPIEVVVAFVPQFSVDPQVVPWEHRWSEYRDRIDSYRIRDASAYFVPQSRYVLFSGGRGLDRKHAGLFPVGDNINHYVFSGAGHAVAADLKEQGLLDRIVGEALSGDIDLAALKADCAMTVARISPPG